MEFCGSIWRLLWVIIMLVLVNWEWCSCDGCWEQERIALLQLKASINHPNGISLPSWVEGKESSDCCQWESVQCNTTTRRVIQVSLEYTRDRTLGDWYLNASIFLPFVELKNLYLAENNLVGWFENEGMHIPPHIQYMYIRKIFRLKFDPLFVLFAKIFYFVNEVSEISEFCMLNSSPGSKKLSSRLSNLEVLDLSYNSLNNSILSSLDGLSSLKSVNLKSNKLEGPIRIEDLDSWRNLEKLDLSDNEINSFENPKGIKTFSKLEVLKLDRVKCNASILLQFLGAFSSLKTLYLRYGSLEGTIKSQDMHNLSNLEVLFLDGSSLNKDILQSIGVMTSLKVISLFDCGLNGTLPTQGWCELKSLQELDLSENDFEGLLPSCLGNLTSLRVLDLSNNQFIGNIALAPLDHLTSLEYISLSKNHFRVPISFRSFANHSNLKVILSDSNKLEVDSKFPTWVPKFQLKVFSLSQCASIELNATPPNFLFYQNQLRFVDLSHNHLGGKFLAWFLKNNTELEKLNLRSNSFKGPLGLPSHPNPNISTIDISNNNVQGQIPTNMSLVFPNLLTLNMSGNMFEGNIPSSFGDMKSLTVLDLSSNQLSGGIPKHLAMGCSSLWIFKLSNNNLNGKIFPKHANLNSLERLYLDGNNFVGEIPDSLSNTELTVLDVSNNHLSGRLPRWLGNMSYLVQIGMSRNHIEGPIPLEFCNLQNLVFLDLSENNLSGYIPSCSNASTITHVHLNKNELSGPMTRAFYNSSSLVTLDLRENNLTGNIPNWIGTLSALSILLLKANHFEGRIPTQICHLNRLSIMDLSQNNLSGPIPPCLSNITFEATDEKSYVSHSCIENSFPRDTFLAYVWRSRLMGESEDTQSDLYPSRDIEERVVFTTKSMTYLYRGDVLTFMSGFDLSCNQLTGEIPLEIGNLREIRALNLSHNNLIGSMPATLSNLSLIESLDLSYNHLNGRIPSQLTELYWLAVFSVAHNNLSGATPDRKAQFGTFEESSYEGNPLLCGPPLHNNCATIGSSSPMPNALDGDEGEDNGFMDMSVFYISFVVSYMIMLLGIAIILYINPYWRRAWFHLVEVGVTSCYYFVLDNFPLRSIFRPMSS